MITLFFGNPGCGKTTVGAKMAKRNRKKYHHVYTTFRTCIDGVASCDLDGLGRWRFPSNALIVDDEAGIDFNSRAYKSMPKEQIKYFKEHRHYGHDWLIFSQSWEDTDVTLRRLTVQLWYVYRFGPWSLCRRVYKRCMVDKNTSQIIDGYRMASPLWLLVWPLQLGLPFDKKWTLTFRPFYYRYFDSWAKDESLDIRDFPVYTSSKQNERKQKNYFVAFGG